MVKYTLSEYAVPQFKQHLLDAGFEVNDEKTGFRVLKYRKNSKSWTKGDANSHTIWVAFAGPEVEELCLYLERQDIGELDDRASYSNKDN